MAVAKAKKYYALADILVDGEHVGAGDEVVADKETIDQLVRLRRVTVELQQAEIAAAAAKSAKSGGEGDNA